MLHTFTHCGALHLALAGILLLNPFGAGSVQGQELPAARAVSSLDICDILGAEFDDRSNQLLLYASEACPDSTPLYADDVVKMGLAVLTVGNFAFSLERAAKHMEIWYLPVTARDALTKLFQRSTVEATFYKTDRVLKDLANGRNPDGSLPVASALLLCSRQLCGASQVTANDFASTYVTYFDLDVNYISDGLRVWFDKPTLVVKAASRRAGEDAPDCIKAFAEGLTRNMDRLMGHPRLGADFRRLRNLLLLGKVFGWASSLYVPISLAHMQLHQTGAVEESRPFKHADYHIVCPDAGTPDRVRDIVLRGGVHVAPAVDTVLSASRSLVARPLSSRSAPALAPSFSPPSASRAGRPALGVRTSVINGRRMLALSIDQIVGLE
jgi:hypothetical protein